MSLKQIILQLCIISIVLVVWGISHFTVYSMVLVVILSYESYGLNFVVVVLPSPHMDHKCLHSGSTVHVYLAMGHGK